MQTCGETGTRGGENAQGDVHKKKKRPTDLKKSVGQCLPDGEDVVEPGDGVIDLLGSPVLQFPDVAQAFLRLSVPGDSVVQPGAGAPWIGGSAAGLVSHGGCLPSGDAQ